MWRPHPDSQAFLDALAELEAPARYYALVDAPAAADDSETLEELLENGGLRAAWFRHERFWRHVREDGDRTWWLHLAASGGRLELGLYLRTPRGDLGGPTHSLVLKAARRRSRGFTRKPPYPRLPLTTGSVRFARWLLEAMASAAGERFDAR